MNTTRTVEIEVCGECQEDIRPNDKNWHYFTCPQCLRSLCKNIGSRWGVEVGHYRPHGYPREEAAPLGAVGESFGPKQEYEFSGTFCEDCSERIESVLLAAGLSKNAKPQSRYAVVLD